MDFPLFIAFLKSGENSLFVYIFYTTLLAKAYRESIL